MPDLYKRTLETQLLLTYDFQDICHKNNSPVFLLTCQIRSYNNEKKIHKEVFQVIDKTIECTQIAFPTQSPSNQSVHSHTLLIETSLNQLQ